MYTHACIKIHTCMCTHTHMRAQTRAYLCTHAYTHALAHVRTHAHASTRAHENTHLTYACRPLANMRASPVQQSRVSRGSSRRSRAGGSSETTRPGEHQSKVGRVQALQFPSHHFGWQQRCQKRMPTSVA